MEIVQVSMHVDIFISMTLRCSLPSVFTNYTDYKLYVFIYFLSIHISRHVSSHVLYVMCGENVCTFEASPWAMPSVLLHHSTINSLVKYIQCWQNRPKDKGQGRGSTAKKPMRFSANLGTDVLPCRYDLKQRLLCSRQENNSLTAVVLYITFPGSSWNADHLHVPLWLTFR